VTALTGREFAAGVTCSDCHDPHSGKLKASVDAVCGQCHAPAKYETVAHRQHAASPELSCASCHMPVRSYMELPGPDIEPARRSLADPDPMVRIGALDMLEGLPPGQLFPIAGPALADPIRGVRIRAAELLASVPSASLGKADREAFARAAAEFVAAQRLNADRPEARMTLSNFAARQGNVGEAEAEYRSALRLDPLFPAAAVNLADLYRARGRDSEGEQVLREAIARSAQDASLHHALGLTLVRLKQSDAALDELRRAAELEPERARYAYVYAVGLQSAGRRADAIAVLKANLQRHPNDRDSLAAMIGFSRESGDGRAALEYAERLAKLTPDDALLAKLIEDLRRIPISRDR
jgi:Flp pilus assembly protein TadD